MESDDSVRDKLSRLSFNALNAAVCVGSDKLIRPLYAGKQFRIKMPTLALDETMVQRNSITLPVGSIINVIDGPRPDNPLIRAVWEKRWILMYEHDLRERAEETV
jgi:hypothetical protein